MREQAPIDPKQLASVLGQATSRREKLYDKHDTPTVDRFTWETQSGTIVELTPAINILTVTAPDGISVKNAQGQAELQTSAAFGVSDLSIKKQKGKRTAAIHVFSSMPRREGTLHISPSGDISIGELVDVHVPTIKNSHRISDKDIKASKRYP